jgi:hypothetical protein
MKILTDWNIDGLTIVNAKREPAGLVDSRDLPKLKIMQQAQRSWPGQNAYGLRLRAFPA